jgi:hypothetical protein
VLRVEGTGRHHFRLVVRHPTRALDLGFGTALRRHLDALSATSLDELRHRFEAAERSGMTVVRLRHVTESVDLWHDDFWNWIG